METKTKEVWVHTRIDGRLGWWPATEAAPGRYQLTTRGRHFICRLSPDKVRTDKPKGA